MRLLPLWTIVLATACTDVDLYAVMEEAEILPRVQVRATVCAPPDTTVDVPYRVLFVVDTSESNSRTDPVVGGKTRRGEAVRSTIEAHLGSSNVSFGIITFADVARRQTYGFVNDAAILRGATDNVSLWQGGTNYSDTLWTAIDFIEQDLGTLSLAEAGRTRYVVYWVSDGAPTVGVTDAEPIVDGVRYLRDVTSARTGSVTLHTLFLGGAPDAPPAQAARARSLLQTMAQVGQGSFVDIPAGQTFELAFRAEPIRVHYALAGVVASNLSLRPIDSAAAADSDADGLADDFEVEHQLNPGTADTDGDGVRDGVEHAAGRNPGELDPRCDDDTDADLDGLRACEEELLGTLASEGDTDADGLPDGFEHLAGVSPVSNDLELDVDGDGLEDAEEVSAHLDVRVGNDATSRAEWGYVYTVAADSDLHGCYRVHVGNVAVRETLPTARQKRGENHLHVLAAFAAVDGPRGNVFLEARATVITRRPDIVAPADREVRIEAAEFAVIAKAGAGR